MKTLSLVNNYTPLSKKVVDFIRANAESYPEILNNIFELELCALQFYNALPRFRKNVYTVFTQKTNCSITWRPKESYLTFSHLLFVDTVIFKVSYGVATLIGGDMGELSSVNSIKNLMLEAVEFYLEENQGKFKDELIEKS